MKIGFSSLVCPQWNLETIVNIASEYGFDGVELRGLLGEFHLPLAPELAGDPPRVKALFAQNNVELVCLGTSATLDSRRPREVIKHKAAVREFMELAAELDCPYVKLYVGEVQRWDTRHATLARIADALASLVPAAVRYNVNLLVENGGDFPGSEALWYLIDSVAHPAVRCCWNPCNAMTLRERATISVPRLGQKIAMVHVCDATFDERGVLGEYKPLGEGDVGIARLIELLKGVVYRKYLMFEWPKRWVESLPAPDAILPQTAKFLKERIEEKQSVLTAYKGDKNAPKLAPPTMLV